MEKTWQEIGILVVLLIFFVIGVFAVIGTRKSITSQPSVTVNLDDTTYTDKTTIPISGKATNTKNVTVNGQTVSVASDGTFSADVALNQGENKIDVVAKNDSKQATAEKTVVLETNKSVAGANTGQNQASGGTSGSNLNQSGPAEDLFGVFGLAAIISSLIYYRERKKKSLNRFNLYTN